MTDLKDQIEKRNNEIHEIKEVVISLKDEIDDLKRILDDRCAKIFEMCYKKEEDKPVIKIPKPRSIRRVSIADK